MLGCILLIKQHITNSNLHIYNYELSLNTSIYKSFVGRNNIVSGSTSPSSVLKKTPQMGDETLSRLKHRSSFLGLPHISSSILFLDIVHQFTHSASRWRNTPPYQISPQPLICFIFYAE